MQVLYVLVDKVAQVAGNPLVFNNFEEARRYYSEVVCREGTLPHSRPDDFEWLCVGKFDRVSGKISISGLEKIDNE